MVKSHNLGINLVHFQISCKFEKGNINHLEPFSSIIQYKWQLLYYKNIKIRETQTKFLQQYSFIKLYKVPRTQYGKGLAISQFAISTNTLQLNFGPVLRFMALPPSAFIALNFQFIVNSPPECSDT